MNDRHAHIQQMAPEHRVTMLCALLGVSRSGYYDWRGGPGPRQQEEARLSQAVEAVFVEKRRTYGRVRLTHELRARGHPCGERRVGRLMRARNLHARPRRRFRPQTTDSRHDGPIAPNRLAERPAPPSRANEVWVTDFTFIPTREGWLFLTVVLDLYSRRVVGWAFGCELTAALARAALQMALQHRRRPVASQRPRRPVRQRRLPRLAGGARPGGEHEPHRQPLAQRGHGKLLLHAEDRMPAPAGAGHTGRGSAVTFDFIEAFYHRERIHNALGYKSPVDFEQPLH